MIDTRDMEAVERRLDRIEEKLDRHLELVTRHDTSMTWIKGYIRTSVAFFISITIALVTTVIRVFASN